MKKIFGFGKKKKGLPSPSKSASLPVGSGGYGLRERDLGKLHRAAATGDLGKLQQLLRKQDSNQLDKENRTPLHLACANGHLDIVSYLIENKCKLNLCDNDSRSPLMKAVQCQQEKCATLLLEHGADPNVVDVNCNTALHFAACIPNISLAIELLEHDADIDAQNKDGHTPLTLAITENHQGMVEFLLQKGADVHAVDKSKRTPLMVAASGGELSLIKILLEHGADLSHKDVSGCTAEDYAHLGGYSGLGKQLSEYARWKTVEKPSPGNKKGMSVFSSPDRFGDLGYALGAPATDKEVIDDLSQGDSVRSSEKGEGDDSWLSSEEELDFTPKKQPKLNLSLLLRASQKFKENIDEKSSIMRTEHVAISLQNKSDCEAEEVTESPPKPLSQVKSFPHPIHPSPGSFSKRSQMAPPLLGFTQEESSSSSEEEEEEEEEQLQTSNVDKNLVNVNPEVQNPSENVSVRKNMMSALGLEEEEDTESPWDSECASESPRKPSAGLLALPALRPETHMQSISEEPNKDTFYIPSFIRGSRNYKMSKIEDSRSLVRPVEHVDFSEKHSDSQQKSTREIIETNDNSYPTKVRETGEKQKSDLMEEFGLDDADDIEDASDWDSTSVSLKNLPNNRSSRVMTVENHASPLSALTAKNDTAGTDCRIAPPKVEEMSNDQTEASPQNTSLHLVQKLVTPKSKDELPEPAVNVSFPDKKGLKDPGENCEKQVAEEKRKQKYEEIETVEKEDDVDESDVSNLTGSTVNLQMKQKVVVKGNEPFKKENEETIDEDKLKMILSSKERTTLNQISLKSSKPALNMKDLKKNKNKKRISKQRANQQMNSTSGSQFDDSTLSETSQDEGRPRTKSVNEKNTIASRDVADDLDDLTQSSDTPTEDLELPTTTYKEAMLLIEQLTVDSKDSVILLKIQNMLHGYERLIEREKGRYTQLLGKVRKLENENKELQLTLEETRELKSRLDHQKMEWESDVSSLKYGILNSCKQFKTLFCENTNIDRH